MGGRKRLINRPTSINLTIPTDLRAKLDLECFSEIEGRIPYGAYQRFFVGLLRGYYRKKGEESVQPRNNGETGISAD